MRVTPTTSASGTTVAVEFEMDEATINDIASNRMADRAADCFAKGNWTIGRYFAFHADQYAKRAVRIRKQRARTPHAQQETA